MRGTDMKIIETVFDISYIYQPFRRLDNGLYTGSNFTAT
jgi:hypothetical protein